MSDAVRIAGSRLRCATNAGGVEMLCNVQVACPHGIRTAWVCYSNDTGAVPGQNLRSEILCLNPFSLRCVSVSGADFILLLYLLIRSLCLVYTVDIWIIFVSLLF